MAPGEPIGNVEHNVVAYCNQPRNGARLIPDGTIKSAHFIKTDMYVQISGTWDGTKVNVQAGDYGGGECLSLLFCLGRNKSGEDGKDDADSN